MRHAVIYFKSYTIYSTDTQGEITNLHAELREVLYVTIKACYLYLSDPHPPSLK